MLPRRQVVLRARKERRMDSFTSSECAYVHVFHIRPLVLLRCEQRNWGQAFIWPGPPDQRGRWAVIRQALAVCDACATITLLTHSWLLKSRLGSHPVRQVVTASVLLGKFSP
jgi:hypothetical protein